MVDVPGGRAGGPGLGIELVQLRQFVAVAEAGSLRGAARAGGWWLPTVSRGMRRLEERLGVALLERQPTGIRLTAAGRVFLREARQILAGLERATVNAGRAGRAEVGGLALGFTTSLVAGRLHALLAAWHQARPEVTIEVMEGPQALLVAALQERRLDLALVVGLPSSLLLKHQPLWSEPLYAAVPLAHRLARRGRVDWGAVADETVLLRSWESGVAAHDWLVGRLAAHGHRLLIAQHPVARENLLGLVRAGFGITLVAEPATAVRYPGVAFRRIAEADAILPITAAWLPDNENPVLQRFVSFLSAQPGHTDREAFSAAAPRESRRRRARRGG